MTKSTNIIVLVRSYTSGGIDATPLFSIDRVVADSDKATSVVEKLNEIAEIEKKDDGWTNKYYSTKLVL